MEPELLKTVGQIAGIGGLGLGVFLILFRDIVRKTIFAQLTKERSYRLLRLIVVLVWSVAVLGIGAWVWAGSQSTVTVGTGVGAGGDIDVEGDFSVEGSPPNQGN